MMDVDAATQPAPSSQEAGPGPSSSGLAGLDSTSQPLQQMQALDPMDTAQPAQEQPPQSAAAGLPRCTLSQLKDRPMFSYCKRRTRRLQHMKEPRNRTWMLFLPTRPFSSSPIWFVRGCR
jgi:hypothetical protein